MDNYLQNIAKYSLKYFVIFKSHGQDLEEYSPILSLKKGERINYHESTMHMLDSELVGILPAIWYTMHLPRIGFDVIDLDESYLFNSYDQPNDIDLIPSNHIDTLIPYLKSDIKRATLIVYEDGCEESAARLEEALNPLLKSLSVSQLSKDSLINHWKKIWEEMKSPGDKTGFDKNLLLLMENKVRLALPLLFLSNQLGDIGSFLYKAHNTVDLLELCFLNQLEHYAHIDVLKQLHERNVSDMKQADELYPDLLKLSRKRVRIPVVISMAGVATPLTKFHGLSKELPVLEKEFIQILGVHRAVARSGIYVELQNATNKLFEELNLLEISCREGTNSKYVWNSLVKFGKMLSKQMSQLERNVIMRAEHITVFSDFPIGLAIFDENSAPLCCYKPISYRPLTPLTRAIQNELHKQWQHYFGTTCKVLIAECLEQDDKIRKYSDAGWDLLDKASLEYTGMEIVKQDISSINEMKVFLNSNRDADILIISAHGSYQRDSNIAGICIGKEVWMANDNDYRVPPVVLFSACHVSPRGAGVVSVTDLLMRNGAVAILGTFIPVNVRRNSLLMLRLFIYIMEARAGSNMLKTLAEAWSFVVASNAVNEIINSSSTLMDWATKVRADGSYPLKEFQLLESVGKLRYTHVYEDTINILKEMLARDGLEKHFDAIVRSNDFFPESLFYQLIGFPENVFLYNEVIEKSIH
jgi:hypothetical protein